jgi:nicotinamidase-related amidase
MSPFQLTPASTQVLIIDMQERFLPAIPAIAADGACGRACRLLVEGAGVLQVPVTFSEQVPEKLGTTLAYLQQAAPSAPRLAKQHFSCQDDQGLQAALRSHGRGDLVIAGIEAQVCVLATAVDCLAAGYRVIVAADAIASRIDGHVPLAVQALVACGALVLPVEAVLMRLQRVAAGERFAPLIALVRASTPGAAPRPPRPA